MTSRIGRRISIISASENGIQPLSFASTNLTADATYLVIKSANIGEITDIICTKRETIPKVKNTKQTT